MIVDEGFAQHVVTRLFDFFTVNAPWQRRLWNTGSLLALRELDEAIEAHHLRVLTPEAVRWLAESIKTRVKDDQGVGSDVERTNLVRLLGGDLTFEGGPHRRLRLFIEDIERHYLERWAAELRAGRPNTSREGAARAIGAHLLDAGFSQQRLREWLVVLSVVEEREFALADVVQEAKALVDQAMEQVEVLVLYERTPPGKSGRPDGWANRRHVRQWLDNNGIGESRLPPRAHSGLIVEVESRDVYSAVAEAGAIADAFASRVALGTRKHFVPLEQAFVAGVPHAVDLRRSRRVDVFSLDRHGRLYGRGDASEIDSALELVSHLDRGQGPVAVAGGWSAVEFLLRGPGDATNVMAADRLAEIVACSWPRAELTTIALTRIAMVNDELSTALARLATNRERCDRLLVEIRAGSDLNLTSRSDNAALDRVRRLTTNPVRFLNEICDDVRACLRRLYRQRNLVLHGGRTRSVALEAALRTAAPIVGAGADRIVHAYLAANRGPLEVAARAKFELERAGSTSAPDVTALLE